MLSRSTPSLIAFPWIFLPPLNAKRGGGFSHTLPGKTAVFDGRIFHVSNRRVNGEKLLSLCKRSCNPQFRQRCKFHAPGGKREAVPAAKRVYWGKQTSLGDKKIYSGQIRWNTPKNRYRWIICGRTVAPHTAGSTQNVAARIHSSIITNAASGRSILCATSCYLRVLIRNVLHVYRRGLWLA